MNHQTNTDSNDWLVWSQLQDLETTILDASPEELHKLHAKLKALVTDLPETIQSKVYEMVREASKATGETSDGYHTFNELYHYRMLYNALYVNELVKNNPYAVHKSRRHSDGELCFGGGWFVVTMDLPTGQVTNHYELKHWDKFHCAELDKAPKWDGHTPQQAAERMEAQLSTNKKGGKYEYR